MKHIHFFKIAGILFLAVFVSGCSKAPSDSEGKQDTRQKTIMNAAGVSGQNDFEEGEDSIQLTSGTEKPGAKEDEKMKTKKQSYIFPNSDTVLLMESDIFLRDIFTLKLAKNEIFARKGYLFRDKNLLSYFTNMPWYVPNETVKGTLDELNETERKNVELLEAFIGKVKYEPFYGKFRDWKMGRKDFENETISDVYKKTEKNGRKCYMESFTADFNCDGREEKAVVCFYIEEGEQNRSDIINSAEIEITDADGRIFTELYEGSYISPYINIADFDIYDNLLQFYIFDFGPSYDTTVQIYSFDGEQIIKNIRMPGNVTRYDGMSRIYSFEEYNINCYYDLHKGLVPLPKENIVGTEREAVCNIMLFKRPFTYTTAVITAQFLTEQDEKMYMGGYEQDYIGLVPAGTRLEILDIEFGYDEYEGYDIIPWLKVRTPDATEGWFCLYYGD